MITFVRELCAVPLRIASGVCNIIPIFDQLVLAKIIMKLTGSISDTLVYLNYYILSNPIEASRNLADRFLSHTGDSKVAVLISIAEQNLNNTIQAEQWIAKAIDANCANQDFLFWPKLIISISKGTPDYNIVDEIISHNDLPMNYSSLAYRLKCNQLVFSDQLEQANNLATKVLCIQDYYIAYFIQWTYQVSKSNLIKGEKILSKAIDSARKSGLEDTRIDALVTQGKMFLEATNELK